MGSIRRSKTKRRTRDLDQVHSDIHSARHLQLHKAAKVAEDLPGLGQQYCVDCAKWFESETNLLAHRRGKNHKRRARLLKQEPYSQKEADAAAGVGVDNGKTGHTAEAFFVERESKSNTKLGEGDVEMGE